MSTQAVSNLSIFQELQNFYQDRSADMQKLGSALAAGDLNSAQQIYSDLVTLGQEGPFRNSEPFSRSDRAAAFEALGQALQSGDLTAAQAAFADLPSASRHSHEQGGANSPAVIVNLGGSGSVEENQDTGAAQSIYEQRQSFRTERKSDVEQLGKALASGDLNAAQEAYDALVALGQEGPFRDGKPFHRTDRAQAFDAIGTALGAGDLSGAQQAFQALADTFGNHHDHVNGPLPPTPAPATTGAGQSAGQAIPEIVINIGGTGSQSGSTPEVIVNVGSADGSAKQTPEEIQINFGGDNGSGGQVKIDVNPSQDGSGEQVAINFSQGSGAYQLVLNLLSSSSGGQNPSQLSLQA